MGGRVPDSAAPETAGNVETPSGKHAGSENFPVGSFLLPAEVRPCVAAFYAFARAGDDIADNPALSPDDKISRLNAMRAALLGEPGHEQGFDKAHRLRVTLAVHGVSPEHACALLEAFKQDAVKSRYATLEELHGYCRNSADPVGRFLVDLHGDGQEVYPYSDGLCTALQILNHLQDCGDDLAEMDRCYIPQNWMAKVGASTDDLRRSALTPAMRRVLDALLDDVDRQLALAGELPRALTSRRLAMESAVIVRLARQLASRLRAGDPLAMRVALSRGDFLMATIGGAIEGFVSAGRGARL